MNITTVEEICSECTGLDLQDFAEKIGQECECGAAIDKYLDYRG